MIKKVLYFNSPKNDFLSDSVLIGLKQLQDVEVFEYPLNSFIYKRDQSDSSSMHGIGFTLYHLLDANLAKAHSNEMAFEGYDLYIFGDIYRQGDIYNKLKKHLNYFNTIILDGEDTTAIFPYYFAPWKKPYSFFFPRIHKQHVYFKRELIAERALYYLTYKLMPSFLLKKMKLSTNVQPISFSIPNEKITKEIPLKTKLFGKHIVDGEVATKVPHSSIKYAFDNEEAYYNDLKHSQYGITTKRGGWDCLRHYEIAANGSVICFKNLHLKPDSCAPHGLIHGHNCLSYKNFEDLQHQIENITPSEYEALQHNSMLWGKNKSCEEVAKEMLFRFETLVKMNED